MRIKKIDKSRLQIAVVIIFVFSVLASCALLLFLSDFREAALALTGNYSKNINEPLLPDTDWNNLDDDFLIKSGDTMAGPLDMGNNSITNTANAINPTDVATKQDVDSAVASAAGGEIFVNWGREDCPAGTTEVYDGIGFGGRYPFLASGDNQICLQAGDAGGFYDPLYDDGLYPMVSGTGDTLPPDGSIPEKTFIKCAVCYKNNSTCFESYGSWNCNGAVGFSPIYDGYLFGGVAYAHWNSTERGCLNRNFDGSMPSPQYGAMWYGSRVEDNFGVGSYDMQRFTKCAVCCN